MEKGLVLQERDIELLEFLAEYKTITLDNTRYIYGTKTYQEKRKQIIFIKTVKGDITTGSTVIKRI